MELKLRKQLLNQKKRDYKINKEIISEKVRIIDSIAKINEIVSLEDALRQSLEKETDLIQITEDEIPICKLMDYDKFHYQQQKAKRENKQTVKKLKQVKFHPNISSNDLKHKITHITEFINDGHKCQILLQFKGRENQHKEFGRALFDKILEQLIDVAKLDNSIHEEGNTIKMVLTKK